MKNIYLKLFLIDKCKNIKAKHILFYHNLFFKIIKRFIIFRLKIFDKDKTNLKKIYDSKSMAMHFAFK